MDIRIEEEELSRYILYTLYHTDTLCVCVWSVRFLGWVKYVFTGSFRATVTTREAFFTGRHRLRDASVTPVAAAASLIIDMFQSSCSITRNAELVL